MTLKNLLIVPMLALGLFAVGCGADCESQCEDSKDCADSQFKGKDCADYCKKVEDLNDKAGCTDQFDDLVSCGSDQDDVCNPPKDACKSETDAYLTCYTKYCTAHAQECMDALK